MVSKALLVWALDIHLLLFPLLYAPQDRIQRVLRLGGAVICLSGIDSCSDTTESCIHSFGSAAFIIISWT